MTAAPSPAQHALSEHIRLTAAGETDTWATLFAPDGVLEFPFAPAGMPRTVQGHDALVAHMAGFPQTFDVEFVDVVFHETVDPHLAIAEFRSEGTAVPTGKPYRQEVVSIVHTDEEGLITHFLDYWNPLIAIEALTPDEARSAAGPSVSFGG
ncbi:nuclear transport factor 2 family protein [Aeromicrobium chenweiae]|uniref:Isomerase n=1 Tax=Aeromicrobium chenweiae TaxID=2079793 RepID=A0A2S0WP94_9ACTN|nr:nuclear transport factor 2 family protein [Aeromicrobium chenweiae]AWB93131.1 isomerase [Aeromicrobium chenweiae]TGN34120.1 nuclear transport factor 2 family protein [Aeromicrobium chenweiae]